MAKHEVSRDVPAQRTLFINIFANIEIPSLQEERGPQNLVWESVFTQWAALGGVSGWFLTLKSLLSCLPPLQAGILPAWL